MSDGEEAPFELNHKGGKHGREARALRPNEHEQINRNKSQWKVYQFSQCLYCSSHQGPQPF